MRIFFINAYPFQLMRIDKRISEWNRIEKLRTVCGLCEYPKVRKNQIYTIMQSFQDPNTYIIYLYKRISTWYRIEIMHNLKPHGQLYFKHQYIGEGWQSSQH